MDIEKQNLQTGEADATSTPIPEDTVKQVFNQQFHGSVGNVATGSHDFEQSAIISQTEHDANLPQLAEQLAILREELLKQASAAPDAAKYAAIGAISEAEVAAKKKDKSAVVESLKKAGQWTLNAATGLGIGLAVEYLKASLGIGHTEGE